MDSMGKSAVLSGLLHLAVVVLAIVGLPWFYEPNEILEATPIAVVSEAQFDQMKDAKKPPAQQKKPEKPPQEAAIPQAPKAPDLPEPTPEPEPQAQPEPPPQPEVPPQPEPQAAPPAPEPAPPAPETEAIPPETESIPWTMLLSVLLGAAALGAVALALRARGARPATASSATDPMRDVGVDAFADFTDEDVRRAADATTLLEQRLDEEVRARVALEERLAHAGEELKVLRDRLYRVERKREDEFE